MAVGDATQLLTAKELRMATVEALAKETSDDLAQYKIDVAKDITTIKTKQWIIFGVFGFIASLLTVVLGVVLTKVFG